MSLKAPTESAANAPLAFFAAHGMMTGDSLRGGAEFRIDLR
jgi:hypothetical protein